MSRWVCLGEAGTLTGCLASATEQFQHLGSTGRGGHPSPAYAGEDEVNLATRQVNE